MLTLPRQLSDALRLTPAQFADLCAAKPDGATTSWLFSWVCGPATSRAGACSTAPPVSCCRMAPC